MHRYRHKWSPQSGLTLIEIMIVVTIIAAISVMVIPQLSNRDYALKGTVRHLAVLSKQLHSLAKLKHSTYRLVLDLKQGAEKGHQQYWAESANGAVLSQDFYNASLDDDERQNLLQSQQQHFQVVHRLFRKPKSLPSGLGISGVELNGQDEPITTGKVYIYYYPQGLVQQAAIHLQSGKKLKWTLAIQPLTGGAIIVTHDMSLKEMNKR